MRSTSGLALCLILSACGSSKPAAYNAADTSTAGAAAEKACAALQGQQFGTVTQVDAFAQVPLGTYDVDNKVFTWDPSIPRKSRQVCDIEEDVNGKPIKVCHTVTDYWYVPTAVQLQFTIALTNNADQGATFTLGNVDGIIPGDPSVYVPAGAPSVALTGMFSGSYSMFIGSGTPEVANGYLQTFEVRRTEFFGTGCITLPALPIGIVYQPPASGASSELSLIKALGTRFTQVTGGQILGNAADPNIDGTQDAAAGLKLAADALQGSGVGSDNNPANASAEEANILVQVAGIIIQFAADALETGGPEQTTTVQVDTTHSIEFVTSTENDYFSDPALGPGSGDVIVYAPDVKIAYFNHDGLVTFVPLAYNALAPVPVTAASLRPGAPDAPPLPDDVKAALLALDPVASGNSQAPLDTTRYSFVGDFSLAQPLHEKFSQSYTVNETTARQSTYVVQSAEGYVMSMQLGASAGSTVGNTVTTTFDVTGPAAFRVYDDRQFDSFAFMSACTPSCSGRTCGDDGCGGSCGPCGTGTTCSGGQCVCAPSCVGKSCGDNGCGGSCGSCAHGSSCQANQCVCVPNCSGKSCGNDGCGGSCGECGDLLCTNGQCCTPTHNCGGQCGYVSDGCGGTVNCGSCSCTPSCAGKACGASNGCGGVCQGYCKQSKIPMACEWNGTRYSCVPADS